MPWVIVSQDHPDRRHLRQDAALMQAQVDYEQKIRDKILAAGSTRSDDGETPTGGLLILDVETREQAEALFNADPFTREGLRTTVVMTNWLTGTNS